MVSYTSYLVRIHTNLLLGTADIGTGVPIFIDCVYRALIHFVNRQFLNNGSAFLACNFFQQRLNTFTELILFDKPQA